MLEIFTRTSEVNIHRQSADFLPPPPLDSLFAHKSDFISTSLSINSSLLSYLYMYPQTYPFCLWLNPQNSHHAPKPKYTFVFNRIKSFSNKVSVRSRDIETCFSKHHTISAQHPHPSFLVKPLHNYSRLTFALLDFDILCLHCYRLSTVSPQHHICKA